MSIHYDKIFWQKKGEREKKKHPVTFIDMYLHYMTFKFGF